jgi:hypothetical protein
MIGLDTHEAKHVVVSIDAENSRLATVSVQATINAYGRDQPSISQFTWEPFC